MRSTVGNVSALRRSKSETSFDDDLLRQAANSIPIGFVMFDAQKRILVANPAFLEIYELSPSCVEPGTTLADLLKERFRGARLSEQELAEKIAFVEELVDRGEPHTRVDTLPCGRRISVGHRPLPGGGWVGTHEDVTEREAAADRLRYLAHHDELTGAKSRGYFWEALELRMDEAREGKQEFALHIIDLDGFKEVNDSYGHEAGDIVLKKVAERIMESVRVVDIVARLGGDEFAIVQCQKGLNRKDAEVLASRLIEVIRKEIPLSDTIIRVGASLGIAFANDFDIDATRLVNAADEAMYIAKRSGRNRISVADPENGQKANTAARSH